MCGICGILDYRGGEPVDERLLNAMTATLVHRGPDDEGTHIDGALGLGMRRLSIIDLEGGHQPIAGEDGSVVTVFNGEIYNFAELRRELEGHGHEFRTRCDTEVVVHAYEEWGTGALARLNGMFGLAVWDAKERRLLLARDPFGVKPLYYADDDGRLLFGSEVKAILRDPRVERRVDLTALDQFLRFAFVPAPRTAFAGIGKLRPGHALLVDENGVRTLRYAADAPPLHVDDTADEAEERLRELIEAAVRRQMVADVPVGVMLSGGVDSSATTAVMVRATEGPVESFTVGFGGGFVDDELDEARSVARTFGTHHHELLVSADEFAGFLPESVRALEEPIATPSTLPFFRVCQLARRDVKVVLTGQGADELFAGYDRALAERYGAPYRLLPRSLRTRLVRPAIDRLPRNEQLKRAAASLDQREPAERLAAVYSVIDARQRERLYGDDLRTAAQAENPVAYWQSRVAHLDGFSQMLYVDARFSLPDNLLIYGDKMSMAVSLEARVPFLDLELMRYAESLPPRFKIRRRTQKWLLKRAVAAWVPRRAVQRRKVGFRTPVDEWFRSGAQSELTDRLLTSDSACAAYLRGAVVKEMLDDHRGGRHDHRRILFGLLTFELWHQEFMERLGVRDREE